MRASISLVCFLIYSFKLSLTYSIYIFMLFPVLLIIFLKKKYILQTLKKLLFLNVFLVLVFLSLWFFGKTNEAVIVFIRSNLILFFTLLLFSNLSIYEISIGIQNLKLSNKLSSLFYFSTKFIKSFKDDFYKLEKTLLARGFRKNNSLFTYQTYANIVALLFINAFNNSDNLQKAIISRGYKNKFYEQSKEKIKIQEVIMLILVFLSLIDIGKII